MNALALFFILAAAVSQIAWVVSDSRLFEPFRAWSGKRCAIGRSRVFWRWFCHWVECHKCVGMWVAIAGTLILRPDFLPGGVATSVPVYAFALALVARAAHVAIDLAWTVQSQIALNVKVLRSRTRGSYD